MKGEVREEGREGKGRGRKIWTKMGEGRKGKEEG